MIFLSGVAVEAEELVKSVKVETERRGVKPKGKSVYDERRRKETLN